MDSREGVEHRRELGDGHFRACGIEHDEVGGFADSEAVILKPHHLGRAPRDHVEALAHVRLLSDLTDIRVEVRHAHLRAIAERRERIEDIVTRQLTVHPVL